MSKFDYDASKLLVQEGYPFHALIMGAMRQADSDNMERLTRAFPYVAIELQERYNAPGGRLEGE